MRIDTFEVFLPGSTQPVSLEVYSAYIKARQDADAASGRKSPDVPETYIYSPAPGK